MIKNKIKKIFKNIVLFIVFLIALGIYTYNIIIIATNTVEFNGFELTTTIVSVIVIGYICDCYDDYLENKNASVSTSNKCEK